MKTALRALALVALVAASACTSDSKSSGGGGSTTTTWVGLVQGSDGVESGSLSVTAQTASPAMGRPGGGISLAAGDVTATGIYKRVTPTAATVDLSGTYNPDSDQLDLAGSGYTFTGGFDGQSRLEGNFTGPNGDGNFVTEKQTGSAQVFCGTYSGDDSGTWSFVVSNGTLHGQAQSDVEGVAAIPLDGTVNSQGHVTIYAPGSTTVVLATGDVTGTSASGDWTDPESGDTGTWTSSSSCAP
ncbi:MAG TPA: hypothetical protein VLT17_04865 [Gemmatimonadales bacterium]|nr:hypothetical protein [Gemmatimonadales bacterium]